MAVPVRLRRSQVAGVVPASLLVGEVALNEPDGNLFTRKADGSIRTTSLENIQPTAFVKTASSRGYSFAVSASSPTTVALVTSSIRAFPWVLTKAITITVIFNEVVTAVAGTTFRTAIYTDNNLYPGTLVAGSDPNTYDGTTVGLKSLTLATPITLKPGLYWVASNASANAVVRALPPAAIAPVLGMPLTIGANANTTGYGVAFTYAPFPTTFPSGGSFVNNVAAPLTLFQSA